MTILERFKDALTNALDAFQQHCDARHEPMHPVRANDVIQLRGMVRDIVTASELRIGVCTYMHHLQCVTLYERWVGLEHCHLKNHVEKVLQHDAFSMPVIMMCQVQELAHDNLQYRKELDELKAFQLSLGGMDLHTLKEKIEQVGHLESCNRAMRSENHFLAKQLADKQKEVDRLQQALALERDASRQDPGLVLESPPAPPMMTPTGSPVRAVSCRKPTFSASSARFFSASPSS